MCGTPSAPPTKHSGTSKMSSVNTPTTDELMKRAFHALRGARSPESKQGIRDTLIFRIEGIRRARSFGIGTAQADADFAGREEGHCIWRALQDEQN